MLTDADKCILPRDGEEEQLRLSEAVYKSLALAIPALCSFLLMVCSDAMTIHFLGQLDPEYMGAYGLGSMVIGTLAYLPLLSLSTGLDSIIPQCFGKQEYQMCGQYLNRALLLFNLMGIPVYLLVAMSNYLLRGIGVEAKLAYLSAIYANCILPAVVLNVVSFVYGRFLQGQQVVVPSAIIAGVQAVLSPTCVALFLKGLDWGYLGIALATVISAAVGCTGTVGYVHMSGTFKETLAPCNAQITTGWGSLLSICFYSGLMNGVSALAYHLTSMIAGTLTTEDTATHFALLNLQALVFIMPIGFGSAAGTLVGNMLGERRPQAAKLYAKVCIVINCAGSVVLEILTLLFRHSIASFYSHDTKVQQLIAAAIPVLILANVFDVIQGVFYKLIYALGKQKAGTVATLVSHWAVRLPTSVLMVFVLRQGIVGLWWTYSVSYLFAAVGYVYVVVRENWAEVAQEIYIRLERDKLTLK